MSDIDKDAKFFLKVVINKQKDKVLFAEIDSVFADVLFSFLTLPLGTIVRIMNKHYGDMAPVFGSLTTLYNGLSNLDNALFWTESCKQMLLNPRRSFEAERNKLKLNVDTVTQPTKYFCCENLNCIQPRQSNLGIYYGTTICGCGKYLKKEIPVSNNASAAVYGGFFTINTATFIISDDLQIFPNATASVRQIVSDLGLTDIDGNELRNVTFGFNEIMDLLKFSLFSPTPLTNLILKIQTKYKVGVSFQQIENRANSSPPGKIILKLILQKSTNKLLFAEAEQDFVDFLFGLLIIPLGVVETFLGNSTCLKNIDNLCRSIASPIDDKYLRIHETNRLFQPTIPYGYLSKNWIFPLVEEGAPKLTLSGTKSPNEEYLHPSGFASCTFKSPRGGEDYVKGPRKYMVNDDLTVSPLCMSSYISTLNEQKIPLSDVDELALHIGLKEALSILKASLSSTSALSVGLSHLITKVSVT